MKILNFLTLVLVLMNYITSAETIKDEIKCPVNNCDKILDVCGMFSTKIQCFAYPCGNTFENACKACEAENVVSVNELNCKELQQISLGNTKSKHVCEESERNLGGCSKEYMPVCGHTKADCNDSSCRITYGNKCMACIEKNVIFHLEGACPSDNSNNSNNNNNNPLIEISKSSKIFLSDNYKENICEPEDKKTEVCIELYKPVCGIEECNSKVCMGRVYSNSCFACQYSETEYYFEGECKFETDDNLNSKFLKNMSIFMLVSLLISLF